MSTPTPVPTPPPVPPEYVTRFWTLTPDWIQNLIDRTARRWLNFRVWCVYRVGIGTVEWDCTRKRGCWCDLKYTDHLNTVHGRCRHCTNPHVRCKRCGVNLLSHSSPEHSRLRYVGLFGGWECVNPCQKRRK